MAYKPYIIFLLACGTTFFGVELFRRWSLKRDLLDIPNERSSHTVPTPRGGGLVIGAVALTAFFLYTLQSFDNFYWAYFAGALIVAGISWIDDVRTVSPFWRILCHSLAAILAVRFIGGFENLWIPFYGIAQIGMWGDLAAFLWIVWLINAYNFMDGIDGIAGAQAVTAGIGWCLIGSFRQIDNALYFGGVLTACSLGFLMLNWQPAKIFMGDVGSAFLGHTFAVLPLLAARQTETSELRAFLPWFGVLFVWFFVFDSVFTFLGRLARGEKVWEPHRRHIYQKLVIDGLSHARVTILYGTASLILVAAALLSSGTPSAFLPAVLALVAVETMFLLLIRLKTGGRRKSVEIEK